MLSLLEHLKSEMAIGRHMGKDWFACAAEFKLACGGTDCYTLDPGRLKAEQDLK